MLMLDCTSELQPYIALAKLLVNIIQVAVPILLIVFAMIELFKAVMAKDEEQMKKAKHSLTTKFIAAAIVAFAVPIVIFVLNIVASENSTLNEFTTCWKNPGEINWKSFGGSYVIEKPSNNNNNDDDKKIEDPILPSSSANIVTSAKTSSLIFSIEKVEESNLEYYITRIWMKDPYNQINKTDSPEYGKMLYKPKELLKYTIENKNLTNKTIIAFNASGFYSINYEPNALKVYDGYDKTSFGTIVITDGKIVRNVWNKPYRTRTIAGVTKDGTLTLFTDKDFANRNTPTADEVKEKEKWAKDVINSGIRNTFTFSSPLVVDGKASDDALNMPSIDTKRRRQAICQINTNNFILITSFKEEYGQTRDDLINIMLNLNCQTATNLDGGGSTALLYKEAGSNEIITVGGGSRYIPEIGYFTEE